MQKNISLRHETTPEQLQLVLVKLQEMLVVHPKIYEGPRVKFVNFGDYSLDLEIFAYADTTEWPDFLDIQEDVLMRTIGIVEAAGTGFAFPFHTTYFTRDSGVDRER